VQRGNQREPQAEKSPTRQHLNFGELPQRTPPRHRWPYLDENRVLEMGGGGVSMMALSQDNPTPWWVQCQKM